MPGFDGTGPNGVEPMTGGGKGFCNPRTGDFRNYAFPRWASRSSYYRPYGFRQFVPRMSREHELDYLRGRAEALRDELGQLETEIGKLSGERT